MRSILMLYDSTKALLQSILRSLETTGEIRWDEHTESGNACLYEMHQMSRPQALYWGRDIWCISYRHALPDSVCSSQRISPVVSRDRRILCSNAFVLSYNIPYVPHSSQRRCEITPI